ncbi:MAG: hypothetical protein NTW17_02895 [Candidatus Pacearchaeota archaeon]|nr:hypothetical protein [Candidatus Pacearchaeota archaeon]
MRWFRELFLSEIPMYDRAYDEKVDGRGLEHLANISVAGASEGEVRRDLRGAAAVTKGAAAVYEVVVEKGMLLNSYTARGKAYGVKPQAKK